MCRICFLSRKGQFTPEGLSGRLGIPVRDTYPSAGKTAAWIESTLWRIGVEAWKGEYEEVGITLRSSDQFEGVGRVMSEALAAVVRPQA